MCREGHLKACSQKYDLNDLSIFTHITNYSLQKRCKDFAKYEQGNEISFKKFIELLDNTNIIKGRGKKIFNKIYSKMKEEIQISMDSIGRKLKGVPKVLSFQIFGYDFIVDKDYNPWILEINDNPGLEISSELISHLIPRMIDDALRLTIDKVFPTEYDKEVIENGKYSSKYHLDGFNDEENLFEFICNIEHNKYIGNKNNGNNNNNKGKNEKKEERGKSREVKEMKEIKEVKDN
jgi:tubulin--tyrosine ligase/tubulin polyglutamylase TTLL9